jgi:tetratricopeptide (TPR) repeat protein
LLLINVRIKSIIFISAWICFYGILWMGCSNATHDDKENLETEIFELGNAYIKDGNYKQAWEIYSRFIMKFPTHAYVDDAAYRLAYIHVIVDDMNPYFDYHKAVGLFKNFIENYPNSRYIKACKNWLNVLTNPASRPLDPEIGTTKEESDPALINQLKDDLSSTKRENAKLRKTLKELQTAIER